MYKGRWFIRERVYVCGDYIDADIYPVFQKAGKRRSKCKPTSEIQERINQRNAERYATRLLHLNFTKDDIVVHLTYASGTDPETEAEGDRDLYNFIRRVRRARAKLGLPEMRAYYRAEKGKRSGRVHLHVVMTGGLDRDLIEDLWGKGYANTKRLQFDKDLGLAELAGYLCKEREGYRRWNRTKNFILPEAQVRDAAISVTEMQDIVTQIERKNRSALEERFPGWEAVCVEHTKNGVNHGDYVSFELVRLTPDYIQAKKKADAAAKLRAVRKHKKHR